MEVEEREWSNEMVVEGMERLAGGQWRRCL